MMLVLSAVVAGCYHVSVDATVHDDGSGSVVTEVSIDKGALDEALEVLPEEAGVGLPGAGAEELNAELICSMLEEEIAYAGNDPSVRDLVPMSYSTEFSDDGDRCGVTTHITWERFYDAQPALRTYGIELERTAEGWEYSMDTDQSAGGVPDGTVPGPLDEMIEATVTAKITLPGAPAEFSAGGTVESVTIDGGEYTTFSWETAAGNADTEVYASSLVDAGATDATPGPETDEDDLHGGSPTVPRTTEDAVDRSEEQAPVTYEPYNRPTTTLPTTSEPAVADTAPDTGATSLPDPSDEDSDSDQGSSGPGWWIVPAAAVIAAVVAAYITGKNRRRNRHLPSSPMLP